ncbi:MAG: FKBP-type peptidyl-prolyl cis-trans isomerase [Altererythrobacter sp.]
MTITERAMMMLASAALAALGFSASAQDGTPDYSQDYTWQSAQQIALAERSASSDWYGMEDGLLWRRVEGDGSGKHPRVNDTVTVHYAGTFVDGSTFDSSWDRGKSATFPLGRLIRAWQIAIPHMGVGDTVEIAVPASLGYGPTGKGSIPSGATLLFKVQLIAIE